MCAWGRTDPESFQGITDAYCFSQRATTENNKKSCLRNNLCGQVELNSLLVQTWKIPVNGAASFYTGRNTCQLNWQKLKRPVTVYSRKNTTLK